LLLPSQRYAKISTLRGTADNEKFFWDPEAKCLKNYQYNECLGTVSQGCSAQLVSLGEAHNTGAACGEVRFDGTFLWINGKVAQPQGGYSGMNNLHISLTDMTGAKTQQWVLRSTG